MAHRQPTSNHRAARSSSDSVARAEDRSVGRGNGSEDVVHYYANSSLVALDVQFPRDSKGEINQKALDKALAADNRRIKVSEYNDVKRWYVAGGYHEMVGVRVSDARDNVDKHCQQEPSQLVLEAMDKKQKLDREYEAKKQQMDKEYAERAAARDAELRMHELNIQLEIAKLQAGNLHGGQYRPSNGQPRHHAGQRNRSPNHEESPRGARAPKEPKRRSRDYSPRGGQYGERYQYSGY